MPISTGTRPAACFDHDLDDLAALVGRHAQELAGAAQRDQAVDAFLDLEIDQAPQRRLVDLLAVGGEGRDQHGVGAAKLLLPFAPGSRPLTAPSYES